MSGVRRGLHAVEPYVGPIYGFALRRAPDRYEAEDLAQEILLQICASLRRGPEIRDMHAWVWRIARNTWARWVRTRAQRTDEAEAWRVMGWQPSDVEDAVAEWVERQEAAEGLLVALARTSAEYRQVVVLHYLHGQSVGEIAAATGLAEGTVKRRLHTARNRLRERMVGMAMARPADPVRLTVYTDGRGAPDRYLQRRIARSIAAAAFEAPRTVGELADALGVPAVYVEDEVRHLVDRELMAEVGRRRYQTDFVIASAAVQKEVYRGLEGLVARGGPAVRDVLHGAEAEVRAIGFHGASRPWGALLWAVVALSFYAAHGRYCEREGVRSWLQAPARRDGGQWWAVGYEGYEQGDRPLFQWKSGNNFETVEWDGVGAVFHNAWVEGLGLRAGMLSPREIRTVVAMTKGEPADEGCVADLVMRGFVERVDTVRDGGGGLAPDGTGLRPALPVLTGAQHARVLEVLEPVLRLYDGMIREAYALGHAAMAPRVPKRLHEQLWPFLGGFADDVKGYLLGYLVEEGLVPLPAEPLTSTLGMYVRYGPKG